jgi:hypothetical protein
MMSATIVDILLGPAVATTNLGSAAVGEAIIILPTASTIVYCVGKVHHDFHRLSTPCRVVHQPPCSTVSQFLQKKNSFESSSATGTIRCDKGGASRPNRNMGKRLLTGIVSSLFQFPSSETDECRGLEASASVSSKKTKCFKANFMVWIQNLSLVKK